MAIAALSNNLKYLKEINNNPNKITKDWLLVVDHNKLFFFNKKN